MRVDEEGVLDDVDADVEAWELEELGSRVEEEDMVEAIVEA